MSDFDENVRRVPDWDELEDAAREKRARHTWGCLCGWPDWPVADCSVHGEDLG